MDNEKFNDQPDDSGWFDDLLITPHTGDEIGPDEHAVSSAGLTDISDLELDRIMQEALSSDWGEEDLSSEPVQDAPVQDQEYRDISEEIAAVVASETGGAAEPEEAEEEEPEDPDQPKRKVRPRRKKGYGLFGIPHLLSTLIWLALAVMIGVSMGRLLWVCASDILAFGRENQTVTITITKSDDLDSITNKLYNAGLIKYPQLFKLYADLANVIEDGEISVGTFELNTLYDYHALVNGMSATSSYRETTTVMIPEGYSCAQIYALLEEEGVCSVEDLEAYACESDFATYEFLDGVERGTKYCLEGFLFPDTYEFYTNDSPKNVFIKMLARFENQFSEELQAYIATLNERLSATMRKNGYAQSYIDEHQMTLRDVVIVASMIEKESANTAENYTISSVIYNRLTNPQYLYLNIDATIVYALGGKSDLTEEDKNLDSPYNTYKYTGLPPTPISNPGISSIMAALSPADTDYYYYALDPSANEHHFSKTYQEHLNFLNSLG